MIGLKKYGPRTREIKAVLKKLGNPVNKSARSAAFDFNNKSLTWLEEWRRADLAHHQAVLFYRVASTELRVDMAVTLAFGEDGASQLANYAGSAVQAFGDQGMVGEQPPSFTQEQYEILVTGLNTFLLLIDSTAPNSPEREVACSLVTGGMDATEAVESAKRALLA